MNFCYIWFIALTFVGVQFLFLGGLRYWWCCSNVVLHVFVPDFVVWNILGFLFLSIFFFWSSNVNDMCYVCVCSQWVLAQMTSPHLVRATWRGLGFNTHCLCVCLCVVLRSIWGSQSRTFSWSEWLNLSLVDTCPLYMMNLKLFYAFVI